MVKYLPCMIIYNMYHIFLKKTNGIFHLWEWLISLSFGERHFHFSSWDHIYTEQAKSEPCIKRIETWRLKILSRKLQGQNVLFKSKQTFCFLKINRPTKYMRKKTNFSCYDLRLVNKIHDILFVIILYSFFRLSVQFWKGQFFLQNTTILSISNGFHRQLHYFKMSKYTYTKIITFFWRFHKQFCKSSNVPSTLFFCKLK